MRYRLEYSGPLDLELTFTCGQAFRWRPEGRGWSGVVGGSEVRVEAGGEGVVHVEAFGAPLARADVVRYLRLDVDPRAYLVGAEELLGVPGFEALLGLRLLRQDPWETLVTFVCSAAANVRKISGCVEGMSERWGRPIAGSARRSFPTPQRLARAREADLRALGLGFRAPYVRAIARRVASVGLDRDALRRVEYDEARAALTALPGVGRKVADCTLLFGLDRLEAWPVDRWIRRATLELSGRRRAGDETLERWAGRFGPGRGYVQQVLFHLRRTGGPLPRLAPRRVAAHSAVARIRTPRRENPRTPVAAVALLAKAPAPGRAKTRLSPPLTPEQAAGVAHALLGMTLASIVPAVPARWTLFLDGPADAPLRAAAREHGVMIQPQGRGDLGARLAAACTALRARGATRVVAIGADSPTLDPARVREALAALDHADVVLGPTVDGGYYLVGLRAAHPEIFRGIPWSTGAVLEATLARARGAGLTIRLLEPWYDVDGPEDLRRLRQDLEGWTLGGPRGAARRRGDAAGDAARRLLALLETLQLFA